MTTLLRTTWTRLRTNMRDPLIRRNVAFYMGGKLLGLALVLTAIWTFLPTVVHAATGASVDTLQINAVNTVWTLIAAFLVFCMQVGFVMLEAGFARSRESVNILVEGIADTCICGILFWAWGFAFMFEPGTPLIGKHGFFLQGLAPTYGATGIPLLAYWVFQFAFADTASTITSGAMIGRCSFAGDMLYSIGVTGFIYPIIGHWTWGPDGWLATLATPFHDFAGSTVVHSIGGAISLAGAIVLARVGKWDLGITTNGFLAGLVAITCPCYWVSPTGAFFIGLVAGVVVIWAIDALEYLRIDDPIGAVPVHLVAGIWGTLSLGLFATGAYGAPTPTGADTSAMAIVKGLFYGGGASQLVAQIIGSSAICLATLSVAFVLM